jgi:ankyrin repeat protein
LADNLPAVKLLLEKGANPSKKNNRGTSVLMLMMKRTQIEMADACLNSLKENIAEHSTTF